MRSLSLRLTLVALALAFFSARPSAAALRDPDTKAKVEKLEAISHELPSNTKKSAVDQELLKAQIAAGRPEKDVRATADRLVAGSKTYGDENTVMVYAQILSLFKGH